MTAVAPPAPTETGLEPPAPVGDTALVIRPLTVVPEGEEFLVGDPETATFVVLPAVGVRLIEVLRSGRTPAEIAESEGAAGRDVDVLDFAQALVDLGFAVTADAGAPPAAAAPAAAPGTSRWLRLLFSRAAWAVYVGAALGAVALLAIHPALVPRSSDIFFLGTPVRSLAALTLAIYALAAAHECCHWLAARAEGIRARITLSRRLYFLVLEIDLTGLWGLPRRRRYSALLAGMAFDTLVLLGLLAVPTGADGGWWRLGEGGMRLCAALTFVQVAALGSQFWIFVRTDVYAVLVTATGYVNLSRVTRLTVRRSLRLTSPEHERELAEAHPRDVAVARWYLWVYVLGVAAAGGFFVVYFVPASVRLFAWTGSTIAAAGTGSERFWEAVVFGVVILSPQVLTMGVALRDLGGWRRRRAARP